MKTITAALLTTLLLSTAASAKRAPIMTANLMTAKGKAAGVVTLLRTADGLGVNIAAKRLPKGTLGVHIHSVGKCEGPKFTSAGPHWNPTARQHGRDNPMGSHHGDLPNLIADKKGRAAMSFVIPAASINDLFDADGAAIVIHAKADDYHTDPSGNSGDRIVCGVFTQR